MRVSQEVYPITAGGFTLLTFGVLENAIFPGSVPKVARKCSSIGFNDLTPVMSSSVLQQEKKKKKSEFDKSRNCPRSRALVFNLGTEQEGGKRHGMNQIRRQGGRGEEQKGSLVF